MSNFSLKQKIFNFRMNISKKIQRKLLPSSFTIISDDCWGGQLYRQLKLEYKTPTIGLWIEPKEYLDFIESLRDKNEYKLIFLSQTGKDYPIAKYNTSTLHFMHYSDENEARIKFSKRFKRIDWKNIFIKIDFNKPGFRSVDIERWNTLKLKNSIAFYAQTTDIGDKEVFNGVLIKNWTIDGASMFNISREYFNIFEWINNGKISKSFFYKTLNILFIDLNAPRKLIKRLF